MTNPPHPIEHEEIMAYLDGELAPERAAAIAAHLNHCVECMGVAADLRSVSEQMLSWQIEPAPEGVSKLVLTHLTLNPSVKIPRQSSWLSGIGPAMRRSRILGWGLGLAGASAALLLIAAVSIPNMLRSRLAVTRYPQRSVVNLSPFLKAGGGGGGGEPGTGGAVAGGESYSGSLAQPYGGTLGMPQSRSSAQPTSPMIALTASLTLVTKDFDRTRASIEGIVRQHQGYTAELNVTGAQGSAREMSATYRIPTSQLGGAMGEIKKLAMVTSESQSGDEVTEQHVDLNARLENANETEGRLNDILEHRTGKMSDVLNVEREVARVRGEIERMEAERKNLETRVALATLSIDLREQYNAQIETPGASPGTSLRNAAVEGYRNLRDGALGLIEFILTYGPVILFWGLMCFFPSRYFWQRLRRPSRSATLRVS